MPSFLFNQALRRERDNAAIRSLSAARLRIFNERSQLHFYNCNLDTIDAFSYNYEYNPPGCTPTDYESCSGFHKTNADTTTSKNIDSSNVVIYPNPASEILNIELISPFQEKAEIIIYNTLGNKLQDVVTENDIGNNKRELNISSLFSGCYYVQVIQGIIEKTFKIIVIK